MVHLHPNQLRKFLPCCDSDVILVLCECLHKVLRGHVRVKVKELKKERKSYSSQKLNDPRIRQIGA